MADQEYNGWRNYPTWCIKLWIDNDQGFQQVVMDAAEAAALQPYPNATLQDALKEMVEELCQLPSGMAADLLGWAIEEADWFGIAEAYLEEVAEAAHA